MKGQSKVIDTLNSLLAEELTAINQYMVHSEMCENWGYGQLHEKIEKRAIDEMKHGEKLIGRLLFLEAKPVVTKLNEIHIGPDVKAQLTADLEAETSAIKSYNDAIALAGEQGDNGTADLLQDILDDEEEHLEWIEAQLDQINQMGVQNYLAMKA